MNAMSVVEHGQWWRINATTKGIMIAAALALGAVSHASPIVLNGGFDDPGTPVNAFITQSSPAATTSSLPAWFMGGVGAFERVYSPGCGGGGAGCGSIPLYLAGPVPATSPAGGNFFALDADPTFGGPFGPNSINQYISVLPGQTYALSFWYAAGQDIGLTGAIDAAWQVSLDGVFLPGDGGTLVTPAGSGGPKNTTTKTLHNPSQDFTGWAFESLTFIAPTPTGYSGSGPVSELLTFLGISPNGGLPPVLLLDAVSVNAAPEPGSLALLGAALMAMVVGLRKRI